MVVSITRPGSRALMGLISPTPTSCGFGGDQSEALVVARRVVAARSRKILEKLDFDDFASQNVG